MKFLSPSMQRLVAGLALAAAFLVMASVFVPLDSRATQPSPLVPLYPPFPVDAEDPDHRADLVWPSVDPHEGLQSVGTLEQGAYIVFIYATEGGPRYTVVDRQSGDAIATLISAERVGELFPKLPLPQIEFSAPLQVMYVPTESIGR